LARIAGVDIPNNKVLMVSLTYIYGIGNHLSREICKKLKLDPLKRVKDLTDDEKSKLNNLITSKYKVEGELRSEVRLSIKRLMDIGCYRGIRHSRGLPLRGQRTHSNARTRKGPRGKLIKKK